MDWKTRLELSEVWQTEDAKKISAAIASQLAALPLPGTDAEIRGVAVRAELVALMRDEIVAEFKDLSEQEDPDVDDFDEAMNSLYDWADGKVGRGAKLCWVDTIGVPSGV